MNIRWSLYARLALCFVKQIQCQCTPVIKIYHAYLVSVSICIGGHQRNKGFISCMSGKTSDYHVINISIYICVSLKLILRDEANVIRYQI